MPWAAPLVCLLVVLLTTLSSFSARTPTAGPTAPATQRAIRAAEYILRLQDASGAIRDAADSRAVNMDNNMGYALAGLAAAFEATQDIRYLAAMRRGLEWLAQMQEPDGAWHWGYLSPEYRPFIGEYYRRLGITDIKGVDAIQAYFAYNLYLYVLLSGDQPFGGAMVPVARRGIDYLLAHNYDGTLFYSSWQLRGDQWHRLPEQYSAGQGDVYLGLMGLYRLTADARYPPVIDRLEQGMRVLLRRDVWVTSNRNPAPYHFSNGYLAYIFRHPFGLSWLSANQNGSAIAAAALAIGKQANRLDAADALATLAALQGMHGGVAFADRSPYDRYYYTNDTAFAVLAWLASSLQTMAPLPAAPVP